MTDKQLNDKSIWDEIYRKTENKPGWDLPGADPNMTDLIGKHGGKDDSMRILDVGCGNGRNAPVAESLGAAYCGTDFSSSAVAHCRELYPDRDFFIQDICADLEGTELGESGPYDVVMDCGCFHAIPTQQRGAYIANAALLCRPGGLLVIGSWHRGEGVDGNDPQYYPYLYLSEWFFNAGDIESLFGNTFELIDSRVDRDVYPGMFDGFAYFALRRCK